MEVGEGWKVEVGEGWRWVTGSGRCGELRSEMEVRTGVWVRMGWRVRIAVGGGGRCEDEDGDEGGGWGEYGGGE